MLSEKELGLVDRFVSFLKTKRESGTKVFDEEQLAQMYRAAAGEERKMAQEGMADYLKDLKKEDTP